MLLVASSYYSSDALVTNGLLATIVAMPMLLIASSHYSSDAHVTNSS